MLEEFCMFEVPKVIQINPFCNQQERNLVNKNGQPFIQKLIHCSKIFFPASSTNLKNIREVTLKLTQKREQINKNSIKT